MKKRRLSDLYQHGRDITIDDGDGGVTVWVQKLSPVDHESALRKANAARARVLSLRNHKDTPEYEAVLVEVQAATTEDIITELVDYGVAQKRLAVEAELAAEEEWDKDDYLQGLKDAWEGGLKDTYATNKEDPEASRVFVELKRFLDTADERIDAERARLERDFADLDREELEERLVDRHLDSEADMEWIKEYRKCEVWLSVRDAEDHSRRYFRERKEIDDLAQEVLTPLVQAYQELSVDVLEGKDSRETPASSPTSEQQNPVETEVSSGHEGAAA